MDESLSGSNSEDEGYSWIPWFCGLKANEFFCCVDESFANDSFNLTGLSNTVTYYDQALDLILDNEPSEIFDDETTELIENDAESLYGLIHARFILTARGLQMMVRLADSLHTAHSL